LNLPLRRELIPEKKYMQLSLQSIGVLG
jgi:hypothetical protein